MREYTIVLEWDAEAEAFSVVVPALPGCATFGRTREDALANAQEAIELYLSVLRDEGTPFPDDIPVTTATVEVAA